MKVLDMSSVLFFLPILLVCWGSFSFANSSIKNSWTSLRSTAALFSNFMKDSALAHQQRSDTIMQPVTGLRRDHSQSPLAWQSTTADLISATKVSEVIGHEIFGRTSTSAILENITRLVHLFPRLQHLRVSLWMELKVNILIRLPHLEGS